MTDLPDGTVGVSPHRTAAKIADYIRAAQAEAAKFPEDSIEHRTLHALATGAWVALKTMTDDLGDALRGTGGDLN